MRLDSRVGRARELSSSAWFRSCVEFALVLGFAPKLVSHLTCHISNCEEFFAAGADCPAIPHRRSAENHLDGRDADGSHSPARAATLLRSAVNMWQRESVEEEEEEEEQEAAVEEKEEEEDDDEDDEEGPKAKIRRQN